ncbi:hypothetical protein M164_2816 [Sulfolobus islandicus M.16.4]|uniref:Uncharacterized protein n=1 Tax=Saccharolobus islandicus (strain M.16.4 / Kamchatka \|nr:hypothetical protein M164_2816 [Sulfolobus islandicus M.16.4]
MLRELFCKLGCIFVSLFILPSLILPHFNIIKYLKTPLTLKRVINTYYKLSNASRFLQNAYNSLLNASEILRNAPHFISIPPLPNFFFSFQKLYTPISGPLPAHFNLISTLTSSFTYSNSVSFCLPFSFAYFTTILSASALQIFALFLLNLQICFLSFTASTKLCFLF